MTYDKEMVKERVSIRDLFERDGHVLKRAGAEWKCRCPLHEEKTSSCVVHGDAGGWFKCFGCDFKGDAFVYWQRTRGVDFKAALAALAGIAGISEMPGDQAPAAKKAPKPEPEEVLAPEMTEERKAEWRLASSQGISEHGDAIAEWRGYSVETVKWAAQKGLMGMVYFMADEREAFLIERPVGKVEGAELSVESKKLIPIGWHIRLAPNSPGNPHPKASWRYAWKGIGAWPFVMGDVATAKAIFCMEGQWDALALVDLMEWARPQPASTIPVSAAASVEGVPKGIAVVGMRGATSWKLFLKHYAIPVKATVFAIADADNAGKKWFEPGGFVAQLRPLCRRVCGYFPKHAAAKDFNDLHKARAITAGELRVLRGKMKRGRAKRGETFLKWCRRIAGHRGDEIGQASWWVVQDKKRPKGWRPLKVWERHWHKTMAGEQVPLLKAAWAEWVREGKLS